MSNDKYLEERKEKLNIFQKIRLSLQERKKQISFEEYIKLPDYIKENETIIRKLFRTNDLSEEQIEQIPEYQLINTLGISNIAKKLSLPKRIELIEKGYLDIRNNDISEEEKNEILEYTVIQNKQYSFIQNISGNWRDEQEFLKFLKEKGQLKEILPHVIDYFSEGTVDELIRIKPELLSNLSQEKQESFIQKKPKIFALASPEIQLKYMEENATYIKIASNEAKKMFINKDPSQISNLDKEMQIDMIALNPKLIKYISFETKKEIFEKVEKSNDDGYLNAVVSLLKEDINNTKYLYFMKDANHFKINLKYYKYFDGIENWDNNQIIQRCIHSKMMSAIGNLMTSTENIRSGNLQDGEGITIYNTEQFRILQKLNESQISELINIDSNYSLAYFFDKENGKEECKQLFSYMYGKEKLQQYEKSIEIIFDQDKQEKNKQNITQEEIPLENLKIIFNKEIIEKNSSEAIQEYLQNGSNNKELFRNIIRNAYGEKAYEILKSRPELNVHSINSLEIFSRNILGEYGEAFVHDCISYNIKDFSEFLEITKDPQKQELFNTYYETLNEIYGKNVETMQKAISEYSYIEELLKNAKEVELTDKQYSNLISVMCSHRNPFNIKTLEELQNYNEIANKELKNQMAKCQSEPDLKEIISENFLGMEYKYKTQYGDSVEYLNLMYDLQNNPEKTYTNDEREMLEVLSFIRNEENIFKLKEFATLLMQQEGIRNPITLQTAIAKTKHEQTNILNQGLLGIDKIESAIEEEKNKEDPSCYKEEIDGVTVYHLNGIEYTVLAHDPIGLDNKDKESVKQKKERWMNYEGKKGTSNICCEITNSKYKNHWQIGNNFLFTKLDDNMIIGAGKRRYSN